MADNIASDQKSNTHTERPSMAPLQFGEDTHQSFLGEVIDYAKEHPVVAGLAVASIGVAAYGAARLAFAGAAGIVLGEAEPVAHLTNAESAFSISQTGRLGSRWGVFAVKADQVPTSQAGRVATTFAARDLSSEIFIQGDAAAAFRSPTPVGPFSLTRNLIGVKSTPLGSIDLATNRFVPNEIFSKGVFREATSSEIVKYKTHQWLLDYGTDAEIYALGAAVAARDEHK